MVGEKVALGLQNILALPTRWRALFLTKGWVRSLALFGAGGLMAFAFAPYYFVFLAVLSLCSLLLWLENTHSLREAFIAGWLWGWGYFVCSFYWVSFSLGIDLKKFAWLLPLSTLILPGVLAILIGGVTCLTRKAGRSRLELWLFFVFFMAFADWVRGTLILGGFPWNLFAYVWGGSVAMMQSLSLWGVYGLGFVTLILLSSPFVLLPLNRSHVIRGGLLCACFCVLFIWGSMRLQPVQMVAHTWMRLVQPNVPQEEKWRQNFRVQQLIDLWRLSQASSSQPLTHVIWTESPVPYFISSVQDIAPGTFPIQPGTLLLTGVMRKTHPSMPLSIWNSMMVVDAYGRLLGMYDKVHLVPFGEYIPFRDVLGTLINTKWIRKITIGSVDITPGQKARTLFVPDTPPFSPAICYEIGFSRDIIPRDQRPMWILDLTNDAWFKNSAGLYQHFDQARFRAAEEGLPAVRSANTGISGVIDPYGRVLHQLPIEEKGFYDFQLPASLPPTLYSLSIGPWIFWIMMSVWFIVCLFNRRERDHF